MQERECELRASSNYHELPHTTEDFHAHYPLPRPFLRGLNSIESATSHTHVYHPSSEWRNGRIHECCNSWCQNLPRRLGPANEPTYAISWFAISIQNPSTWTFMWTALPPLSSQTLPRRLGPPNGPTHAIDSLETLLAKFSNEKFHVNCSLCSLLTNSHSYVSMCSRVRYAHPISERTTLLPNHQSHGPCVLSFLLPESIRRLDQKLAKSTSGK